MKPYPMLYRVYRIVLALLVIGSLSSPASAQQLNATLLPSGFEDILLTDVPSPTAIAFTPDGRMLITSKNGALRLYQNNALQSAPVIDLTPQVCNENERGLDGVTVDPDFASNHFIYLYYTYKRNNSCAINSADVPVNRLSRFVLGNNNIALGETVLIDNILSTSGVHNSGDLHFGNDGYLYISVGDGGCHYANPSRCQNDNYAARDEFMLLGKILRITRDGAIPPDNPFQGSDSARCYDPAPGGNKTGRTEPGKKCQETFVWGLRNPFRFAFDPNAANARFFINDVGGGDREEINEGQRGADYGWNCHEGTLVNSDVERCKPTPTGMIDPIYEYEHGLNVDRRSCNAITGAAFVPNDIWPSSYTGLYLYADYDCGAIFTLKQNGSRYTSTPWLTASRDQSIITMAFGPFGATQALYYTSAKHDSGSTNGQLHRVALIGGNNHQPSAQIIANKTFGDAPLTVNFDATASSDADGDALTYAWEFGDGKRSASAKPSNTFAKGTYTVKLTVRDKHDATSVATLRIDSGNTPPVPKIDAPAPTLRYMVGQPITLQGSATDAQDGTLGDAQLSWSVALHHDEHTHPFRAPTVGRTLTFNAPAPEDLHAAQTSYLEIALAATDSTGLTTVITQSVYPQKVNITLASVPAGIKLRVNGTTVTTPHTLVSWAGYQLNVVAESQFDSTGQWMRFDSWSDGGANTHSIITPGAEATYTASFVAAPAPVLVPQVRLPLIFGP